MNYVKHNQGVYASGTVYIKLIYDEPIRFYDDSAAGKGALYLDLQADRETGGKYLAYLTELKDNYMVFSCELPDGLTKAVEIASISMDSLFKTGLDGMQQVGPAGSFPITDQTGEGFDTSSCYITDLAGNPLRKETIQSPGVTLDPEDPYVAKVEFQLEPNNADVKADRGVDQLVVGSEEYKKTTPTPATPTWAWATASISSPT